MLFKRAAKLVDSGGFMGVSVLAWRMAFVVCALAVLVLALMPAKMAVVSTGWDKTNHLLAFCALGMLGCLAFPGQTIAVWMGLLAYGGMIEVLQSFTPDRSAEWGDWLADCFGLVLAWVVFFMTRFFFRWFQTTRYRSG